MIQFDSSNPLASFDMLRRSLVTVTVHCYVWWVGHVPIYNSNFHFVSTFSLFIHFCLFSKIWVTAAVCLPNFYSVISSFFLPYNSFQYLFKGLNVNLGEALQFLREYDREASTMCNRVTSAQWQFATNVTDHNRRRMV